ncbi:hypothetical protein EBT25_07280 [bacterium]|jgi:hypothetical protein|nr:hypothetical protein [bacterium]
MANKFQIKRTTITGRTANTTDSGNTSFIDAGELAINLTDGKLFSSNGTASFEIGANLSSLSVTGVATHGNTTVTGFINVSSYGTFNGTVNATAINIGANVNISTSTIAVGNATVNSQLTSTTFRVGALTVNSTAVAITSNDFLKFADGSTQNTAFRVYDSSGTRIA